ncbi:hypothetical protein Q8A67_006189 [Cirrhinus molitorella]|uniref:Uncharacterized protein n=1 Tax=Cirrhinus molitorella TaxID=172907 RepID=A0AA88Q8J1_9TELE|nr:hypothetical protein Q8A67_006189 [Cirrhinus molitorella]
MLGKGPAFRVYLGVLSTSLAPSQSVRWHLTPGLARENRVPVRAGKTGCCFGHNGAADTSSPSRELRLAYATREVLSTDSPNEVSRGNFTRPSVLNLPFRPAVTNTLTEREREFHSGD